MKRWPIFLFVLLAVLGGLVWLYDKTRKRIVHPKLGTLTFYGDHWEAMVLHYKPGKPAVVYERAEG